MALPVQRRAHHFCGDGRAAAGGGELAHDPAELGEVIGPLVMAQQLHGLLLQTADLIGRVGVEVAEEDVHQRGDLLDVPAKGLDAEGEAVQLIGKQGARGGHALIRLAHAGEEHPVPPAYVHLLDGGDEPPPPILGENVDIVEEHHGSIDVDSVEGTGTEFIIRIPEKQEPQGN